MCASAYDVVSNILEEQKTVKFGRGLIQNGSCNVI